MIAYSHPAQLTPVDWAHSIQLHMVWNGARSVCININLDKIASGLRPVVWFLVTPMGHHVAAVLLPQMRLSESHINVACIEIYYYYVQRPQRDVVVIQRQVNTAKSCGFNVKYQASLRCHFRLSDPVPRVNKCIANWPKLFCGSLCNNDDKI